MFGCVACGWIGIRILLLHCRCNAYEVDGKCLTMIIITSGLDKRFQPKRGECEWENEAIRKGDSHCCPPESWCPIRELLCSLHIPDDIPSLGISSSQSFGVSTASWLSNHPGYRTLSVLEVSFTAPSGVPCSSVIHGYPAMGFILNLSTHHSDGVPCILPRVIPNHSSLPWDSYLPG